MFCIQYFKGFSVFRTFNVGESAEYIIRFVDKIRRSDSHFGYYHTNFVERPKTYTNVVKKVKKDNVTPENIGSVILSQIPGISAKTSLVIMNKYGSLLNLLKALEDDRTCLNTLTYTTKSGQERRISGKSINSIIEYLLYQKSAVIKIDV
jgi:ERCC4-type nuclease